MEFSNIFIGHRIREARKVTSRTQKDLARALGKTAGAISQLEQGNVQITVIELHKIAEFLNKPIEYFFGEDYFGEDVQALIAVIRKMPLEIRKEQVSFIRTMLFMQEMSDDLEFKGDISDEELAKSAKTALENLNIQLAVLKNLWDQSHIAKKQLEEIIGIDDIELE